MYASIPLTMLRTTNALDIVEAGSRRYVIFTDTAQFQGEKPGPEYIRVAYRPLRDGKEFGPEFFVKGTLQHTITSGAHSHGCFGFASLEDARRAIEKHSQRPYTEKAGKHSSSQHAEGGTA